MSDISFSRLLRDRAFDSLFQWLLLAAAIGVGALLLWDYGFLTYLFSADTSYISAIIVALFAALSLFCLYLLLDLSPELRAIEAATEHAEKDGRLEVSQDGEISFGSYRMPAGRAVTAYMRDVAIRQARDPEGKGELLVRALSAQLRTRVRIGIFMSDVLYKLGLLGTVVGFIMMLGSVGDLGNFDVETLRGALQSMSSGMAVSLLTTIAGLVCGTLLRTEFAFADGLVSTIVQRTARLTEVYVVPMLARTRTDV